MPNAVLVTGVSRFLGGHLAARLAANPTVERVIGVDACSPGPDLLRRMGRTEFVRADIRSPLIAKLIDSAGIDTVVHAAVDTHSGWSGPNEAKEANVLGTMQLLAACQQAPAVRKFVLKSTTAVYGDSPRDPAVFTEDMEPRDLPSSGMAKDAVEVEAYVRGFGRRRPEVQLTTLRFTHLVGPRIDTMFTRCFALPFVPTLLGHDPRLQLLHSEDALAVLERAAVEDLAGVYNVAGDGVLMLTQALRRAGRVPMSVPQLALPPVTGAFSSAKLADLTPEQLRFLNVGRVVDTTRLREQFGFEPRWTSRQAFDDFIRGHDVRPVVDPELVTAAERWLGGVLKKLPVAGERP